MPIASAQDAEVAVSVVVPSYRSRQTIEACLRSVSEQDFGGSYEVIVSDSSPDETARFVQERFPRVRVLHSPTRLLPGAARNRAAEAARGAVLAFTDADCVVPEDWVRRLDGLHQRHDVVGGAVANGNPGSWIGWAYYLSEFGEFFPADSAQPTRNLATPNASCKYSVWAACPFAEDFIGEDRLFHWQVTRDRQGWFDGTLVVQHTNRTSATAFLRTQHRLGVTAAIVRRRAADLPGARLVASPWLAYPAALARLGILGKRLGRKQPRWLLRALPLSPLLAVGAIAWAHGFRRAIAHLDSGGEPAELFLGSAEHQNATAKNAS